MGEIRFTRRTGTAIHRRCGKPLTGQYDTTDDESFWHCFECDQSFTIGGDPAFHMTSVPLSEAEEVDEPWR